MDQALSLSPVPTGSFENIGQMKPKGFEKPRRLCRAIARRDE